MLKIKDNIDLNILEKYGFEQILGCYTDNSYDPGEAIYIEIKTRKIDIVTAICPLENHFLDTLYKLFSANLIERIDDK